MSSIIESFNGINLGVNFLYTGEEGYVVHIEEGEDPYIHYVYKNGSHSKATIRSFRIPIPKPVTIFVTDHDIYKWKRNNTVNDFSRMVNDMHEGQRYKITFEPITDPSE